MLNFVLPTLVALASHIPGVIPTGAKSAPLCRVIASRAADRTPGLTRTTLTLAPACPKNGRAQVRFCSAFGSCLPKNDWLELRGDGQRVLVRSGSLSWWSPYWRAASGKAYRITAPVVLQALR